MGRVLVRSVADHDWNTPPEGIDDLVRGADLHELPARAAFHGVTGCVHRSLRDNPLVDRDVAERLQATHHRAALTHAQVLADLGTIARALDALGVPWLVVKGPVLAESVYPRPDLRGYTDLDFVLPPAELRHVLETLEDAGGRVTDTNWDLLTSEMAGEVHVTLGRDTNVDLHWHLINVRELRDAFRIDMREQFERARRVALPGCTVPTLDRADTLIHLGVHACTSGANRLVWLKDIEQAVADPFPWDEAVARSRAAGTGVAVASMLLEARAVIGTRLPDGVVPAFAGARAWPVLVSSAARALPIERTTGRRSAVRLIARSTRADLRSSASTLGRRSMRALRHPLTPEPGSTSAGAADPAYRHAGSRDAYLEAVARHAAPAARTEGEVISDARASKTWGT
ncbi:MAG TPA: nucleotidyltransferase family protein [Acidimicrobiia bacterium]|nr:nucleotidyltransferase family protein [Acidimicrobiia bacterium]